MFKVEGNPQLERNLNNMIQNKTKTNKKEVQEMKKQNSTPGQTKILRFNNNNDTGKTYELLLKKGNNKPIDTDTYIFSMQSSYNCICNTLNICPHSRNNTGNCYGLKSELNPAFMKNTLKRRALDEKTIDYLVRLGATGAEMIGNEIIKTSKGSRKQETKIKFLRVNETGDLKTLEHFIFIDILSNILYKELGVTTSIYTHRRDLWNKFKKIRISPGLIVLGSGFMADIEFKARPKNQPPNPNRRQCSSNCIKCKHQNHQETGNKAAYCYDLTLKGKGVIIEEELKEAKTQEITATVQSILNQLTAQGVI